MGKAHPAVSGLDPACIWDCVGALDLWGNYVERVAAGKSAPSNVVELARTGR